MVLGILQIKECLKITILVELAATQWSTNNMTISFKLQRNRAETKTNYLHIHLRILISSGWILEETFHRFYVIFHNANGF